MLGMDRSVEQIRSAGGTRQLFRKHVMLLCDRQPPVAHGNPSQLITAYAHIISTSIGMANSMLCVIHFTHLRSHFILFVYFIAVVVVSRTYTTRTSQCTYVPDRGHIRTMLSTVTMRSAATRTSTKTTTTTERTLH